MRQGKSVAATRATDRRTAKRQPQTCPAIKSKTGHKAPVWGQVVTHELGTHTFESKNSERPGNREHVKAITIDGC
jgi:hypothetical protein